MPTNTEERDIKIIECPRDAMQGIAHFIPTETKIEYLNRLLKVGFHTIDCGSFVSPKAIPQMRDTAEVLDKLDMDGTESRLSVIVANERGAKEAASHNRVSYLGYPFSVSETFQKRNTNSSIENSMDRVKRIYETCIANTKEMVVYISMGFGNPYGEAWSPALVVDWVGRLHELGMDHFSISDTVGVSTKENISEVFSLLFNTFNNAEFGAHFHTRPDEWKEKVEAAYDNGCMRFDGAIKGYGGCPMAKDELIGNMPTERLMEYFGADRLKIKKAPFEEAFQYASKVFL